MSDPQNDSTTIIPAVDVAATLVGSILINRYQVERELKRGGFGIVYLAKDLQLHSRPVVVKLLLDDAYRSEYVVQKFRQEVEALSRLDHPGVVGIIDAAELPDGKPFIVMQYVDGITMRSLIKSEGMDLDQTANIIRQMGRALTTAHDKGILHRDLKPDNVMLQNLGHGEQQVKVIDFGIAKIKNSVIAPTTQTSIAAGTVAYMAPEQLRGDELSSATDVYAMAEVAYEMLTGRKPFNPDTSFVLLDLQREGVRVNPSDLRPGISDSAQQIILKSLAFEPANRHQSAREFGDELAAALETKTEKSPPEPAPTRVATANRPDTTEKTVAATFPIVSKDASRGKEFAVGNSSSSNRSTSRLPLLIGGFVLLILLGVGGFYFIFKPNATVPSTHVESLPSRSFNYWLTVQKMRDGKPYQDPFDSSGQEIFEDGWKFRLNFESPAAGYLYLLNEGSASDGSTTLTVLFPNPFTNSGSPYLATGQQMQTGWMLFDQNQGSEKLCIVWSDVAVPELEAVKGAVNPTDQGTIKDANQAEAVRKTLNIDRPKVEAQKDPLRKQTNVKGSGAVIVHRIELEHH
jgi:serine/threonine protein kinase